MQPLKNNLFTLAVEQFYVAFSGKTVPIDSTSQTGTSRNTLTMKATA